MNNESQIIREEIADVARVFAQECWLEGERQGHAVDPHDEGIQLRVANLILGGLGSQIRHLHEHAS